MEHLLTQFADLLGASLAATPRASGPDAAAPPLSPSQQHYIDAIAALGQPTLSQIAARLQISKASVTPAVQKLAALGYVAKVPSARDKRAVHVHLTPAAWQLVDAKVQALMACGDLIRSALSEEEAGQFEQILAKLVNRFNQA